MINDICITKINFEGVVVSCKFNKFQDYRTKMNLSHVFSCQNLNFYLNGWTKKLFKFIKFENVTLLILIVKY